MILGKKNIDKTIERLEISAFTRWYSGNDNVFNGGFYIEKFNQKGRIKELLLLGYDVRTGHTCTSIRGCYDYHIFYKKTNTKKTEIMKKIDINYYTFKGYDVYEAIHPMLFGKYEIYKNEIFVLRALNLKNVKEIINELEIPNKNTY